MHIKRSTEFLSTILEKKGLDEVSKYSDPVKNSLWNYVAGYTVGDINKDLRNGIKSKQLLEIVSRIDVLMTPDNVKVYRTVDWKYMENVYGITKENINDKVGKTFLAKGYTSTTREFKSVWGDTWTDGELCMKIISMGMVGRVDINTILAKEDIDCWEQEEVLLQRNLNFTIDNIKFMSNKGQIGKGNTYLLNIIINA